MFACHEPALAEQLASVDVREFTAIEGLRRRMLEILDDFLQGHPKSGFHPAHEPFYFCASDLIVLPTKFASDTLPGFLDGLNQVPVHSIHHHFIEARLRLKLRSNDFSRWLEEELDLGQIAARLDQIDIYTSTLEDVRRKIVGVIQTAVR